LERHPAARLVAGVLPEGEAATGNLRKHLNLMAKLSACLAPKGLYALTVDRQNAAPEIHCVFEKDTDVRRVAAALGARGADIRAEPASEPSGWMMRRGRQSRRRSRRISPNGSSSAALRGGAGQRRK
jgi:hypothetical protein